MNLPIPRPLSRLRLALVALAATLMLALPGTALASSFTVTLKVPTHSPVTCTNWDITITATKGAKKLSGKVEYYYFTIASSSSHLGGNQSAGDKANHDGDFSGGVFHDTIVFPSMAAAGVTLTFHAVVHTSYGTQTVSTAVMPKAGTKQCKS
jgi:hypothetical protein